MEPDKKSNNEIYECERDSPIAHNDDDNHSNEEDKARSRRADDEGQLLANAAVVLGCREQRDTRVHWKIIHWKIPGAFRKM